MKHWTDNINKKECDHKGSIDQQKRGVSVISDFSYYELGASVDKTIHLFCHDCRSHYWKDRIWPKQEWDEYINSEYE